MVLSQMLLPQRSIREIFSLRKKAQEDRNSNVRRVLFLCSRTLCGLFIVSALWLGSNSAIEAQSGPRNLRPKATAHSVTLTWTASTTPGVSYNIYRGAAKLANVAVLTYVDNTVASATTYTYSVSSLCVTCIAPITGESSHLNTVSVTTPTDVVIPPPSCTAIAVNCRIKVTSTANIRTTPVSATVLPAMIGSEPTSALGTVLAISPFGYAPLGSFKWIEVKFDTCSSSIPSCTGWMGSDNMTVVGTIIPPPPPPTPTVIFICTPALNTLACTGKLTAVPIGSPYTVNATIDGLSVTASGATK